MFTYYVLHYPLLRNLHNIYTVLIQQMVFIMRYMLMKSHNKMK